MKTAALFDLTSTVHKALFSEDAPPWKALEILGNYLATQPLGDHKSKVPPGVFIESPELVYIGEDCRIEPGVYIKGPCYISDCCELRHGAYIRENVLLEKGALVGHASEVKNCFFFPGAKAPHFNYVGDSIVGKNVNLGAGAITANVRFDRKEVSARFGGSSTPSGLAKFGALLGDGSQIGCNIVLPPGYILSKGVCIAPQQVSKTVLEGI